MTATRPATRIPPPHGWTPWAPHRPEPPGPARPDPAAPPPYGRGTDRKGQATRRIDPDDDTGAQSMEYAMLAGGGTVLVTVIMTILRSGAFREAVQGFVTGLIDTLANTLGGWVA